MVKYRMKMHTEEYGTIEFQYFSIDKKRKEFPLCDINGNKIERVYDQKAEYHYENDKGEKIDKQDTFRMINGKPSAKMDKTKSIQVQAVVSRNEAHDLLKEHYYQMVTDTPSAERLKKELDKNDQAVKFLFSNGNGYKAYQSYIYPYHDLWIMIAGNGYLSEQLETEIVYEPKETKKKKTAVEQAQLTELM